MVTRHEFLAALHAEIQPRFYLEIGVQAGHSLRLANCPAWGIDPAPMVTGANVKDGHYVFSATSDDFFADYFSDDEHGRVGISPAPLDLAFIDGMHLVEYAARDFVNVVRVGHDQTVIVFDDVLPYNQAIAAREQPPGDWTGDVWKIVNSIPLYVPFLLVDTQPTGTLLMPLLDSRERILRHASSILESAELGAIADDQVPDWIINRDSDGIVSPEEALEWLRNRPSYGGILR